MSTFPIQFVGVTAVAKANVYFDGKVVSHTLIFPDGTRKTLGVIYPGKYQFNTDAAERMEIVAGQCSVKLSGSPAKAFDGGTNFHVPAKSSFEIEVKDGLCEYVCTFLK
jgi:uncharacterized protein YaiE (UPF0345 family)